MRLLWFAIGERDAPPATRVAFATPVSFLFAFLLQTFEFALVEVVDDGLVLLRLFGGAGDSSDLREEGHAQVVVLDGGAV